MNQQTIQQLNQINQDFYLEVANDFHRTRQHYWPGWHILTPLLEKENITSTLDVGCGNGRFAIYFKDELKPPNFKYHGIDNNEHLLSLAKERLSKEGVQADFEQVDLVDRLIQGQSITSQIQTYNLVTAFGLFHHIPSFELRKKLLENLVQMLDPNGLLIITFWKFLDDLRLKRRVIDPTYLKLDPELLEPHDYILDWKRGVTGYRYCHLVDEQEEHELLQNLDLEIVTTFRADGPTNNINKYLALRKKRE